MRLERGLRVEEATLIGFLVIGDGSRDEAIMRALLHRFNGEKALLMPQDRPSLGLEGSIRMASELIRRFGRDVLIVIDRERFSGRLLYGLLRTYFDEYEVKRKSGGFRSIWVKKAGKSANLYLVIMGWKKAIEENIAVLIREVLGANVKPTKEAVWAFLRAEAKLHVSDLIGRAGVEKLERAFGKALIRLLKEWSGRTKGP